MSTPTSPANPSPESPAGDTLHFPPGAPLPAGATMSVSPGGTPAAAADVAEPRGIPGYEILGELGRGSMGVVYKARQLQLQRLVALKMILSGAHASATERARFRVEAEAIARLQHPHIVQVFEVGEHDGLPYFSLEYCPGGSLEKQLQGTPLPPREAAAAIEQLARAVHEAHARGVVHRDVKPGNVLLALDGKLKISDFGLAKKLDETSGQTQSGTIVGTPSYMAPEQASGGAKQVGPAADVYALGAVLYECLTGRPPFKAASPLDTLLQVISDEPAAPTKLNARLPRDLETICLKCLNKDPGRRYASAEALADDLGRFRAGLPVAARPVGRLERTVKLVRRNPVVAALLAAVVLALAAGAVTSAALAVQATRAAEEAEQNARRADNDKHAAQQSEQKTRVALAETEEALADGLLRPLGHPGASGFFQGGINSIEMVALWDLASLTPARERVRTLFLERALADAGRAEQLENRLGPACTRRSAWTAAAPRGCDELLVGRLRDPKANLPVKRTALAALEELDLLDEDSARAAAGLAADLGRLEGRGSLEFWAAVARKLPADQARLLDDRMAALVTDVLRKEYAGSPLFLGGNSDVLLETTARRLSDGQVRATAPTLVAAMNGTEDAQQLATLAQVLAALGRRLPPEAADRWHEQAAARVTALMNGTEDAQQLATLAQVLAALGRRLPPEAADRWHEQAAARVTALLDAGAGDKALFPLAQALLALGPRLSPATAAAAAKHLPKLLEGTNGMGLFSLTTGLMALTDRLPEAQARLLIDQMAERFLQVRGEDEGLGTNSRMYGYSSLEALAPRLSVERAGAVAERLRKSLNDPDTPPLIVLYAVQSLAVVSDRLPAAQGRPLLDQAADHLLQAYGPTPKGKKGLGGGGGGGGGGGRGGGGRWSAPHLEAAKKIRDRLAPDRQAALALRCAEALEKPGDLTQQSTLTALEVFTEKLPDAQARRLRDRVILAFLGVLESPEEPTITGSHFYLLNAMRPVLKKLSPTTAGPVAARLADLLEKAAVAHEAELLQGLSVSLNSNTRNEVTALAICLGQVLPQLPRPQAERLHDRAADRLLVALNKTEGLYQRSELVAALASLSANLPKDQGTPLLDRLTDRLTAPGAEERLTRKTQVNLLLVAGERLPPRWAAAAAVALVDNLSGYNNLSDTTLANRFGGPLAALDGGVLAAKPFQPLADVCVHLDRAATVQLLKHPLCVGRTRGVVLDHLAKLLGRPAGRRWDLLAELHRRHPETDLAAPPRPAPKGSRTGWMHSPCSGDSRI